MAVTDRKFITRDLAATYLEKRQDTAVCYSEDRNLEDAGSGCERAVAGCAAHAGGAVYRDQRRGRWWDLLAARAGGAVGGCGGVGLPGGKLRGRLDRASRSPEVSTMYDGLAARWSSRGGDRQDGGLHGQVNGVRQVAVKLVWYTLSN